MKKKEKCSATSRWNDASTACIIYRATEEERKELTEKMVETMIGNVDKFHFNNHWVLPPTYANVSPGVSP